MQAHLLETFFIIHVNLENKSREPEKHATTFRKLN
jgi:hypothetical protein